ncbi:PAS domain-containing protein [Reyranella soli]|uniref:PAS domain-containing protein n=1 Tax=Reyranella soli TaxID=1230389 RepID=UPI001FEB4139|nr:PAS domain-containing protein [Reyranella soli]
MEDSTEAASLAFLAGPSETARLIRTHDWSQSLGPAADWPLSLKTTLGLLLHSPVPLVLLWGPPGIMLYNDAYGVFAGDRHPGLLGMPVLEAWPEVADLNSHVMAVGMAGGTLEYKDHELVLNRRGTPERGWMDLFYSPVIAEDGRPGGVIAVVVETTDRVLAQRETAAQGQRLAQMFQDAPSFMAQLEGPEQVFTVTNAAYRQLIAHRDVIGKPIRTALPELAGQGFHELLDRVWRTGERYVGRAAPVMLQRQPGSPLERRLLDFIYQPVRNATGAVTGIFVEGTDVTERERATAAVRENARRLAFLDRLGRATASAHDADEILKTTTRLTGQHLGASICAYADMDADQDGFTIRGDWCAPGSPSILGHYSLADFGVKAVTELSAGRPLVVNDNLRELAPHEAATFQAIGIGATICMPLVKEGVLTALMAVHHKGPHTWTDEELLVIREVTERSWAHIERVRDEAARAAAAERLQLAAAAARFGTFDFDPVNGRLSWDDRCRDLFGLPRDAAVDYSVFLAGIHPDDRERADLAVQHALDPANREPFHLEYRAVDFTDGTERWLAADGRTFFAGGTAVRFIGTVLDISAQKRAEQKLRASEGLFRTMAQAMPNHVWTAPADGQLDWFNDQVYAYSGAAAGSLDGGGWKDIVHPDDLPAASERWELALKSGQTYEVEMRLRRFDGAWHWHIARAVAVKDAEGQVARWIGTNTDIQEQKEISAALVDINAVLEQRVEERTGQLQVAEEALRQAQKMEAVGQLTGGLAHDFNNILQGITGALDRVQHRIAMGRPHDADRFLTAAIDSANRAAALTHRLLAFSRRQTLDPRPLDVNRLIGSMEELVRRTMGPNIAVEVVGAAGLWTVRADGSQLESALLNLCINARDAMPDGGKLTIETANKWLDDRAARERDLPPGQYVSLCVTDTGTGMTPDVIERAFDPFFTTKPLGRGTGLGLSMIYGFVRQSGGQVRIYSEIGKGTTMCLYFPRHIGEADGDVVTAIEPVESGFGETVLVVDDDTTVRLLIAEVLMENHYALLEAGDGVSALRVLESKQRIDLMVTDVGLPGGMNGRQLADAARQLRPALRILFITGYAENAVVGNGHLEPGMAVLAKPFAMSSFANKVREILEER